MKRILSGLLLLALLLSMAACAASETGQPETSANASSRAGSEESSEVSTAAPEGPPPEGMLAWNRKTDYAIVTARDALPAERHAAQELKDFLFEITGAVFPVVTDEESHAETEIVLGNSSRLGEIGCEVDFEALGNEGFVLKTVGKRLVIAGGQPRGTLYGVYTFLEEQLGCRWFTQTVSRIPRQESVALPELDEQQVPVLEYREPFFMGNHDPDWHARNKCNSYMVDLTDSHGYKVDYYPFVHTFSQLIPPEEYFAGHPEYFSEIDGTRVGNNTQLCLTNPEVAELVIEKVKEWIRENPKANIISVSQNDNYNPCECENCRKVDEEEGSHAGTLIRFVNQVAEAVEEEYPDVVIDTLAYQYTRKAPKTVRPRHNVVVRLCSIECCFAHPMTECDYMASFGTNEFSSESFVDDIQAWAEISDRLYVWDYCTNFYQYLNPFPDFKVLAPNLQFFVENHVKGVFEEGSTSTETNGELSELRQYVLAKLLWDPYQDTDALVNEFLEGVYGQAAGRMREYYDLIHAQVADEDMHMGIYDAPHAPYLSEEMLRQADEIFDRAEAQADDEEVLERVKLARFSIRYLKITHMEKNDPERKELIAELYKDLVNAGFTQIQEGRPMANSFADLKNGKMALEK